VRLSKNLSPVLSTRLSPDCLWAYLPKAAAGLIWPEALLVSALLLLLGNLREDPSFEGLAVLKAQVACFAKDLVMYTRPVLWPIPGIGRERAHTQIRAHTQTNAYAHTHARTEKKQTNTYTRTHHTDTRTRRDKEKDTDGALLSTARHEIDHARAACHGRGERRDGCMNENQAGTFRVWEACPC
jgi:hypothetical protein